MDTIIHSGPLPLLQPPPAINTSVELLGGEARAFAIKFESYTQDWERGWNQSGKTGEENVTVNNDKRMSDSRPTPPQKREIYQASQDGRAASKILAEHRKRPFKAAGITVRRTWITEAPGSSTMIRHVKTAAAGVTAGPTLEEQASGRLCDWS